MKSEIDIFYRVNRFHLDALEGLGLTVTPRTDIMAWHRFMASYDADINPSFSQTHNPDIGPGNILWLDIAEGRTVAAIVLRRYDGSIDHLIRTGRLWRAPKRALTDPPVCEPVRPLRGVIVQRGGLFTAPSHRGRGIGRHLQRIALATAFLAYEADYCIAIRSAGNKERHDDTFALARHHKLALRGLAIGCEPTDFWLTHSSRQEAADDLLNDLNGLFLDRDGKTGDEAAGRLQRQDQPAEA